MVFPKWLESKGISAWRGIIYTMTGAESRNQEGLNLLGFRAALVI